MGYRTILIDLTAARAPVGARLEVGGTLAGRFEAVLIGLHVMPEPFTLARFYGETPYAGPELIEAQRTANREIKERVRMVFQDMAGTNPSWIWRDAEGDPGSLLVAAAHTADLVLTEKGEPDTPGTFEVIEELVMAAGVPVLMLPPKPTSRLGETVLVAWNGTREATRAAHGALPFLMGAKRVILCAVGEPAAASLEAAAAMLRRHGMTVQPQHAAGPDGRAGEVLLAQAGAYGADLLVMGAYGHSRLRERVFGGATRHVLREAKLPVLFGG
jgi:nucleotide-binding universal stress UspA family protein